MDNQAFEMGPERPDGSWKGRDGPHKEMASERSRPSLWKLFGICLLAGAVTTAIGLASVSLIYGKAVNEMHVNEMHVNEAYANEAYGNEAYGNEAYGNEMEGSEGRFRFVYRMGRAKPQIYPGGEIQWATYRMDPKRYPNREAHVFGQSLYDHRSKMSLALLRMKPRALRVPHWHFNANVHGYVVQGTAWIGLVTSSNVTTYQAREGQVLFFPRNVIHWIQNTEDQGEGIRGRTPKELVLILFYGTHEELKGLEVDEAFNGTPDEVLVEALQVNTDALDIIRSFRKVPIPQTLNVPPPLSPLTKDLNYTQSDDELVYRYLYDLKASPPAPFQGGVFHWAPYGPSGTWNEPKNLIYIHSLLQQPDPLTLATLRIEGNELGQPHYHGNANELAYVIQGYGQAGVVTSEGETHTFEIQDGDVLFFPMGSQHYLKSRDPHGLLLVLAYSTGNKELRTSRFNAYFRSLPAAILARLFRLEAAKTRMFLGS